MKKSNPGFTFIEVMIAITIVAILLTPLYILQGTLLRQVSRSAKCMHRLLDSINFLYEARRNQPKDAHQFNLEKKITDPPTVLTYSLAPVKKESSLGNIEGIHSEKVQATWQEPQAKLREKEMLVTFVYKPEEQAP